MGHFGSGLFKTKSGWCEIYVQPLFNDFATKKNRFSN